MSYMVGESYRGEVGHTGWGVSHRDGVGQIRVVYVIQG